MSDAVSEAMRIARQQNATLREVIRMRNEKMNSQPDTQPLSYQSRVREWLLHCFGEEVASDKAERNHRFLEEALETVQSGGCTKSEAHQLVEYVYGRPVGEMPQEIGGVKNTLAALCLAYGLDMDECGEIELTRCWAKSDQIRSKHAAKPKFSPLPGSVSNVVSTPPTAKNHITDIPAWLRLQGRTTPDTPPDEAEWCSMMNAAALEIERLRKELAAANEYMMKDINALIGIRRITEQTHRERPYTVLSQIHKLARDALA